MTRPSPPHAAPPRPEGGPEGGLPPAAGQSTSPEAR